MQNFWVSDIQFARLFIEEVKQELDGYWRSLILTQCRKNTVKHVIHILLQCSLKLNQSTSSRLLFSTARNRMYEVVSGEFPTWSFKAVDIAQSCWQTKCLSSSLPPPLKRFTFISSITSCWNFGEKHFRQKVRILVNQNAIMWTNVIPIVTYSNIRSCRKLEASELFFTTDIMSTSLAKKHLLPWWWEVARNKLQTTFCWDLGHYSLVRTNPRALSGKHAINIRLRNQNNGKNPIYTLFWLGETVFAYMQNSPTW